MKIIAITGGVLSGLGKGVAGASIGLLLNKNKKISYMKLDGYLNSDPGTMNPIEHGEVFVLEDGHEVDMDFGHYERFLEDNCDKNQSLTMGKVYNEIRIKERKGDYLGKTVQLIPHVTDLIKDKILELGKQKNCDILIVEIGGTVGDLENSMFIEALRQLKKQLKNDLLFVHLTYVPIPFGVNEQKTKPTQQSVRLLKREGINPDLILCRCSEKINEKTKCKIALFSDLNKEDIFSAIDVDNIYKIPIKFAQEKLGEKICEKLNLNYEENPRLKTFDNLTSKTPNEEITVSIAGKYVDLEDSYASIIETIKQSQMHFNTKININWIETSENLNYENLKKSDCIIVPGGFGTRGVEGKIEVIKYARENNIPFLGICYGMQLAVVEFLRNVCGLKDAHSTEVEPNTQNPAVTILDSQKDIENKGGTMRLGGYEAILEDSKLKEIYKQSNNYKIKNNNFIVSERHRHRFEVNPKYHDLLEKNGLKIVGKGINNLAEFIELKNCDYFVGTQGHPELKSKPDNISPMFLGLFQAVLNKKKNQIEIPQEN